ncbi:YggT family protein [Kerstersia gyiorum]|uniref:Membrane protein n=1 Tax=Kerstersia gyiorum TaxID=206506 RepID=A0A171KQE9_9BURK|nr:YggT family protein [Kerstersia gyiorum]KKO71116.1 membrane protein [Kerstersia gyiorum]
MIGEIIHFLLDIAAMLLGAALLARAWMLFVRLHPFNPIHQALSQVTQWMVQPLRAVFPLRGRIDWASLAAAWLVALIYWLLVICLALQGLPTLGMLPSLLGAAIVTVVKWGFNLLVWLTLIQAILSWVNPLAPVMPVLRTMTDPLLEPIRRVLPTPGGMDFSPLAVLLGAQICVMILTRISYQLLAF